MKPFQCVCVLLLAGPLWAQGQVDPGSSHVPIPARPGADLEKIFAERFGRALAIDDMTKILEKLYPEQSRDQLLRDLKNSKIDWNDPKLRQQLSQWSQHPDLLKNRMTPDELEKLRQQFRDQLPDLPRPPTGKKDPDQPVPPTPMPPVTTPDLPATPTPPTPEDADNQEAEEIMRWLGEHLEGLAEHMEDSPTLRRILRELGEGLTSNTNTGEGLREQLVTWGRYARQARDMLEPVTSRLGDLEMPSFNLGGNGGGGVSVPRISGAGEAAAAWPIFAWVILIGLAVWAIWRLGVPHLRGLASENAWRLGPWPVRPDAVSNRREVIQTFEYLSLLRFGLPAQCWNHREVARQLGGAPADRLARLYEHARYAPEDEPISGDELMWARRDLAELARSRS